MLDTRIQAVWQGRAISLRQFNALIRLDARIQSEHDSCGEARGGINIRLQGFASVLRRGPGGTRLFFRPDISN
ncbi:hypothetical protein TM49_19130 [Martelella endophytica]|uniref:Uncharacterized protein n=1 Tax=Martelella endophytica TaxID=1486262 RepID=A0A0D5LTJ0_MAREN|nr:hypothetical protein TM49_19130 [Martelella endophytica]